MDQRDQPNLLDDMVDIARPPVARPVFDPRSEDEILGYGQEGLPGDRLQRHQRRRLILDEFGAARGALSVNPEEVSAARDLLGEW